MVQHFFIVCYDKIDRVIRQKNRRICKEKNMSRTGLEDAYIMRGSKKLRMGYTTGSCAAAAARGAAFMLLSGKEIQEVKIHTPKGIVLNLELLDIRRSAEKVSCAVRKDGGDDPDVTDKALIYAEVTFGTEEGIVIDGGFGVGRVTKRGWISRSETRRSTMYRAR